MNIETFDLTEQIREIDMLIYAKYRFVITDNGIGMKKEYLEHIFEPFSRQENSVTNRVQGTGLRMAITKNIVDMMSGIIQIESEEGIGSTFEVIFEYLPIAFTDIEMVFNEESHAVDWIFRYANQELARLEKLSLNQLLGKSFGSLFSNMDSKWLRSYERSALYGEVLELMDYSPEIDTNLKVICFPTFKGHCGCILFDLDRIKAVDSSNNVHKIWNTYLRNCTK